MRKRLPVHEHGRPVNLRRVDTDHVDPELWETETIACVWDLMHEKKDDGLWWSVGRDLTPGQIRKVKDGIANRAWYAGYTKDVLECRATEIDGFCFRWAFRGCYEHAQEIERNRQERLKKHAGTVRRYQRKRVNA